MRSWQGSMQVLQVLRRETFQASLKVPATGVLFLWVNKFEDKMDETSQLTHKTEAIWPQFSNIFRDQLVDTLTSIIFTGSVQHWALNGPHIVYSYMPHRPTMLTKWIWSCHHFYRTRVRSLAMLVTNSLTHWLPNSCLVNLIDVTLASEDANSKLVEVVTVAGVDAKDHVGNSLLHIGSWR